jgi:hypothetical protein
MIEGATALTKIPLRGHQTRLRRGLFVSEHPGQDRAEREWLIRA